MSISKVSFVSALSFLSLLGTLPSLVAGHGHVNSIFIGGQYHPGFPSDDPGSADPSTIAWAVNAPSNEFVNDYNSPDIICHKNARPAKNSATIAAGETVEFQWTKWPAHQGPVLDYMARCPGKCEDADKTQLEWFKIDQSGLQSLTGCNERGNTGCW